MLRWVFLFLAALVLLPQMAEALDNCVIPHGLTYTIDEHGVCRKITNNAALTQSVMVPTSDPSEWSTGASAFLNALPPGVTSAACTCGGVNWATPSLSQTIANPTPVANDTFGASVDVAGNAAVIGAYGDDTGASNAGSAYIYNATTGALVATLNNPTPVSDDRFGWSVAAGGNTLVVGAYQDDTGAGNAGSAYVYNATTGALVATLNNPTPQANDNFGWSVATDGTKVVVGAYKDNTGASGAGSAYIYNASTGALLLTLNNPAPAGNDYFGNSVAIDGNTVVVGAHADDIGASNAGSVYIYNATTGALLRTLNNPAPAASDFFGGGVAVDGNSVAVGAYGDDNGATDAGSAYIYNATTGALVATLSNPTPAMSEQFGANVALDGNTLLVTAPLDSTGASYAGSAYIFNATTGALVATVNNPVPAASDFFSSGHVGMDGTNAVVGVYGDDTGASAAGSAYVFSAAGGVCTSCAP